MKKLFISALFFSFAGLSHAQWRDTKHHVVLGAMTGGPLGIGNTNRSDIQFLARGMYYPKRIYAFGAEAGITAPKAQLSNLSVGALNGFFHLKLPLGFYGEAGVGMVGRVKDVSLQGNSGTGFFWTAGYAKSLGSHAALELQYRSAFKNASDIYANAQKGLRFGVSFKI